MANEAPTTAAVSARGRRESITIDSRAAVHHVSKVPGAKRAPTIAQTSPTGMRTDPKETANPRTIAKATAKPTSRAPYP